MKNIILNTIFSCCLLNVASSAYAMPMDNNMSGNSSQMMMSDRGLGITENDIYSHLNSQEKAMYDQLNAQQRAFVVKMVNMAPKIQMMRDKMMDGQGQMQQDHGMMQQDRNMYNQR